MPSCAQCILTTSPNPGNTSCCSSNSTGADRRRTRRRVVILVFVCATHRFGLTATRAMRGSRRCRGHWIAYVTNSTTTSTRCFATISSPRPTNFAINSPYVDVGGSFGNRLGTSRPWSAPLAASVASTLRSAWRAAATRGFDSCRRASGRHSLKTSRPPRTLEPCGDGSWCERTR